MSEEMPVVSVVVPVYNAAPYLAGTFESFEAQTYPRIEFVLVDDGSSDDSLGICRRWAADDPERRKVFSKENGGASSARNYGLDHATGDYVLFWDADDSQSKDAAERMANGLAEADLALCPIRRLKPDGTHTDLFVVSAQTVSSERGVRLWLNGHVSSGPYSKIARRAFLVGNRIRFEEGVINEDVMWTAEMLSNAERIRLIGGEPPYRYCTREGSVTQAISPKSMVVFDNCRKLERYVERWHPSLRQDCRKYCACACWDIILSYSRGNARRAYPNLYKRCRQEYKVRGRDILRYCTGPKNRLLQLLVITGLYGLIRK